jgi:hypothetical protein
MHNTELLFDRGFSNLWDSQWQENGLTDLFHLGLYVMQVLGVFILQRVHSVDWVPSR